jgi:dTMP kinase
MFYCNILENGMTKARYIVLEGTEGVGKTTQTENLVNYLRDELGHKVLQTKEPGTVLSPLTMELRNIMLNAKYDDQLTVSSRELISQAIRSIHVEQVIKPALDEYDFIIQDRGILSGLAYGEGCGNNIEWLNQLAEVVSRPLVNNPFTLYDDTIYLTGNVLKGLETALNSKQEFEAGDAMEQKGNEFILRVSENMKQMSQKFSNVHEINVDNKNIDEVFSEMISVLKV